MTETITIDIPREIFHATRMTPQALKRELALSLFEQGKLSFGKARELAEMTVWEFQQLLGSRGIPVHYDVEDYDEDLATRGVGPVVIVVSYASALINLARIGELGLLHRLYGLLMIPQAVWREVVVEGAGQPGADEVSAASWIEATEVTNEHLIRALRQDLDAGEAGHCAGAGARVRPSDHGRALGPRDGPALGSASPGADLCRITGMEWYV